MSRLCTVSAIAHREPMRRTMTAHYRQRCLGECDRRETAQSRMTSGLACEAIGRFGSKSTVGNQATEEIARNQPSDPPFSSWRAHAALSLYEGDRSMENDQIPEEPKPARRPPWNKGKLIGAKPPLRPSHVWSIRTKPQMADDRELLVSGAKAIAAANRDFGDRRWWPNAVGHPVYSNWEASSSAAAQPCGNTFGAGGCDSGDRFGRGRARPTRPARTR